MIAQIRDHGNWPEALHFPPFFRLEIRRENWKYPSLREIRNWKVLRRTLSWPPFVTVSSGTLRSKTASSRPTLWPRWTWGGWVSSVTRSTSLRGSTWSRWGCPPARSHWPRPWTDLGRETWTTIWRSITPPHCVQPRSLRHPDLTRWTSISPRTLWLRDMTPAPSLGSPPLTSVWPRP